MKFNSEKLKLAVCILLNIEKDNIIYIYELNNGKYIIHYRDDTKPPYLYFKSLELVEHDCKLISH